MEREQRGDRFTEIEDRYAGYEVYDRDGNKIGKVDDLFLDELDNPEYIGVKMGFLGARSTLIPWEMARIDEGGDRIVVSVDRATAKEGPAFDDDEEITPEYEEQVRGHYGGYYGEETDRESGERHPGVAMGDIDRERGEFREHDPRAEGTRERGSDLDDEDELRVQRTEEELRAGTREREAGSFNVRKRVRTDREQISVPKRREEVHVERVPVGDREASEADIGEDEVYMPVTEEEVVVEKRPVAKEEIRLRKDVVEDEEIIEEDVRKEEVDVDDETERRGALGREVDADDETRRRNR